MASLASPACIIPAALGSVPSPITTASAVVPVALRTISALSLALLTSSSPTVTETSAQT